MDPTNFETNANLAKTDFDRGAWESARRFVDSALTARPNASDALTLSALLHEEAGAWTLSAAQLKHAVESNPMDPTARFNISRALAAAGDTAGAAEQVRVYLRLIPSGPETLAAAEWLKTLEQRPAHRQ